MMNFDGIALLVMVVSVGIGCLMLGMGHWLNSRADKDEQLDGDRDRLLTSFIDASGDNDSPIASSSRQ